MTNLTTDFNTATVKKGETFQIDLLEGGFAGTHWKLDVVSGAAKHIETIQRRTNLGYVGRVFEAQERGDIEIVATSNSGSKSTFKVKVA